MKVKIINKSNNSLPEYATIGSAGMDLRAYLPDGDVTIESLERKMIPTGIYIQLPESCEAQIRPRSGLAIKHGISLINCVGTIDSDFTGEICILLINLSKDPFIIHNGDRIAQMIISTFEICEWDDVEKLDETKRAGGGFGHSGKN